MDVTLYSKDDFVGYFLWPHLKWMFSSYTTGANKSEIKKTNFNKSRPTKNEKAQRDRLRNRNASL